MKREGAEFSGSYRGSSGLGVDGALTLSRNRYVKYLVDSVHYGRAGHYANYAGNKMPGVPDAYYGVTLSHRVNTRVPLEGKVGVRGVGKYFVDDANRISVPSHNLVDLTLAAGDPLALTDGLNIRGFIEIMNVMDRRHIGSAFLNPDIVNGVPLAYEPGAPRTFVVSFTITRRK